MKRYLAENEINFYIINGTKTGQELGWATVRIP